MLAWIRDNVDLLNLATSVGMLIIWLAYLQLFYSSYRRQREPNLLIHQADGFDLDSLCRVANMSATNVHVAALLVDAERGGTTATFQPGPAEPDPASDPDPRRDVQVGPLNQGSYHTVGTFRALVDEAAARLPDGDGEAPAMDLTVRVVAFVGPELRPIGARRSFRASRRDGATEVRAHALLPDQLSSRHQRRIAREWLREAQSLDADSVVDHDEEVRSAGRVAERPSREAGAERRSGRP